MFVSVYSESTLQAYDCKHVLLSTADRRKSDRRTRSRFWADQSKTTVFMRPRLGGRTPSARQPVRPVPQFT